MPAKARAKPEAPRPAAPPRSDRAIETARRHFRDGDYRAAIGVLNTVLQREPENFDALAMIAGCHGIQGDYDRAAEYDRRAVEADPRNAQLWNNFGWDLLQAGRVEDAEEAYRRCVDLDGHRASAWFNLARIAARRGDTDQALDDLERAAAERPDLREEAKSQPEFTPFFEDPRFDRIVNPRVESGDPYAEWIKEGKVE